MNTTTVLVCDDCFLPIVNDDYTGLDYSYEPVEADEMAEDIRNGIAALTRDIGHLHAGGCSEEFSTAACPCCGTRLAGTRHEIIGIEIEERAEEAA